MITNKEIFKIKCLKFSYNLNYIFEYWFQSISTRFLTTFWWIFCLVILFLYFISLRATLFPEKSIENQNNDEQTFESDDRYQNLDADKQLIEFLTNPETSLGIDHDISIQQILEVRKIDWWRYSSVFKIKWFIKSI